MYQGHEIVTGWALLCIPGVCLRVGAQVAEVRRVAGAVGIVDSLKARWGGS